MWHLGDESRTDHLNALVVHDGYYYWMQSYRTKRKYPEEAASSFAEMLASIPRVRKDLHSIQGSLSKRVWTYSGLTMRISLIVQNTTGPRKELFDEFKKAQRQ